ncbi:MAG: hypothetical protein D6806_06735 [Deltaproteobacteria bacterium]|nr:MAG: hypothetical protein D6806_06735 [Deltaproteobacteria bacterium]
MRRSCVFGTVLLAIAVAPGLSFAQEATVSHGFLFFASEKYTVDEQTFGIWDDGHEFRELIKDNAEALSAFESYRTWHVTANVTVGLSLAAFVFGGISYMPGVRKSFPDSAGLIAFGAGGGLVLLGCVFEFVAWGKITDAAEIYNKGLFDDGTVGSVPSSKPVPSVLVVPTEGGATVALGLRF